MKQKTRSPIFLSVALSFLTLACVDVLYGVESVEDLTEGMTVVRITNRMDPPEWAIKERELLEENVRGLRVFEQKYYDERGYLKVDPTLGGGAGADDATEPTYNWPLLYAYGADRYVLDLMKKAWEGHFDQYTEVGGLSQEFIKSFDWQHNGEQYCSFYRLGLCDPYDPVYRERIRRFAGFYLGMPNYDPELKLIRSVLNGSEGPILNATVKDWGGQDFFQYWAGKKVRGDTPLNMQITSLVTTAYMLTGEDKYKDWVLEYVDAWIERAGDNGGNFPGNVGLSGTVGEDWPHPAKQFPEYVPDGAKIYPWAGGVMGWAGWSGPSKTLSGVRMGLKNALLLTGDYEYLEPGKRQIRNMREGLQIGVMPDGSPVYADPKDHCAQKHWFAEDIYLLTMDGEHTRWFNKHWGRRGYNYYEMGHTLKWFDYLEGKTPEFPVEMLDRDLRRVRRRIKAIRADKSRDWERECNLVGKNPATTAALTMLTTGAREPSQRGSRLLSRLRYFDPRRRRPGLPENLAALIRKLGPKRVTVTLVNLSGDSPRTVVIQGGAYAEHRILSAKLAGGPREEVNAAAVALELQPRSGRQVEIELDLFANPPTLDWPGGLSEAQ
jgi:hypothetical protein